MATSKSSRAAASVQRKNRFIDLVGQRFGRLIVVSRAPSRTRSGKARVCWDCRCDCGNAKVVAAIDLRQGLVTSCGCYRSEVGRRKSLDLTGQRFGYLTAMERSQDRRPGTPGTLWLCRCDCGGLYTALANKLRSGHTKSCGCHQYDGRIRFDLTGRRFGRLVVLCRAANRGASGRLVAWLCQCDCGRQKEIIATSLRSGHTASCGCRAAETHMTHGESRPRGQRLSKTAEYIAWQHAMRRCDNPNDRGYQYYGGRGIRVCGRWRKSYEAFLADMGRKPSPDYSLDRIDVNGHYSCGRCDECVSSGWTFNCRWADRTTQRLNQRKRARVDQFSVEELLAELKARGEPVV